MNKTPKDDVAKTEWAPKLFWFSLVLLAILVIVIALKSGSTNTDTLSVNNHQYYLAEALTSDEQQKGLGDRQSMPQNQGMLFIFNQPQSVCMWMKGMRFNLDIVWLSTNKTVQHVEQDLSPQTYPKSYCPNFTTKYVIELNAGIVDKEHILSGQQLQF